MEMRMWAGPGSNRYVMWRLQVGERPWANTFNETLTPIWDSKDGK